MSIHNEVMRLKRVYHILSMAVLVLSACALAMSATLGGDMRLRGTLSRALAGGALLTLVVAALLRPGARQAETSGTVRGPVPEAARGNCTFDDVAANAPALRSLKELRDYLREPDKYVRYGARMPKGVLLYGPPGTGKTLLARALAGEAGVPFFALSGSDFVEKYVGVGAGRVRELFRKARKAGRCVIFIDEIDAMGRRRDDTASDERDQTLNALLSEMSGFYTGDGVIVVAATNRVEALDPALLRPGRFDRQIEVGLPGPGERLSILRLHSRNKPMAEDVDLEALAAQTPAFSGASLENLLNEAAILAALRGAEQIGMQDIQDAYRRGVAGEDRASFASAEERRMIAVHEAGHALASRLLMPGSRLARVSILPAGGGAAGYNLRIPEERMMPDRTHLEAQICALLAGRAAEAAVGGEMSVSAGASSDLARATELAAAMVMELGMAGEPAVSLRQLSRSCGGVTDAPQTCGALLASLYARTLSLVRDHFGALEALASALLKAEALDGAAAEAILDDALARENRDKTGNLERRKKERENRDDAPGVTTSASMAPPARYPTDGNPAASLSNESAKSA